jgi:hypothetical protein
MLFIRFIRNYSLMAYFHLIQSVVFIGFFLDFLPQYAIDERWVGGIVLIRATLSIKEGSYEN